MTIRDLQFGSLVAAFFLLLRIQSVSASGNFELQILEISNTNSHLLSGYCCGVPLSIRSTKTTGCPQCATAFRLCLKEYQQNTVQAQPGVLNGCSFGDVTSNVIGGSSFVLSDPVAENSSLVLPFTFRWTKSFTLILQALDMYNSSYPVSEQLIEEASFSGVILPSSEWNTLNYIGKNARITYRVRVQCSENYFNTTCTTLCRPRDDRFGHYTCDKSGNKVCMSGWTGEACEKAICRRGCHKEHGSCENAPGECMCRAGWEGPLCDQCKVYPGCRHGYCKDHPWTCICDTNWGGLLCDQDLNYCGTHEPCLHGGTCENSEPDKFHCTCTEGLSGERCEIVEHPCATQPCKNGGTCTLKNPTKYDSSGRKTVNKTLEQTTPVVVRRGMRGMSSMGKPVSGRPIGESNSVLLSSNEKLSPILSSTPPVNEFTCTCAKGWTGPTCEINIDECSSGPCEHGGTCIDLVDGIRCECPPEWTGDLCHIDVNECESNTSSGLGPCINAESCTNTPGAFTCTCLEGWSGLTCAKDINDCVGQCKNGATCIDLVNDYHCACANGFTGRDCETDIDECAVNPCRNGGECVNMIAKFKCICPVGYSGTLCEEAEDHCSPTPCVEGSCLNTPGGYYCHCPPDRAGRHCELLATPCKSPPCYVGCTAPNSNSSIPCNGHGKCETKENGQNCMCYYGFTGPYCEHNLNDCLPNPCKNNGMCLDGDGKFTCKCAPGWSGKTCTERITQCYSGQCANGGSCAPTIIGGEATSVCICSNGWGGAFCTEPIDQCQGQPCHNGGICESGTGWFRCACAQGFSGPDCRINVNECSPQPCLGGATCIDGIGGFTCICPKGRRGLRCEILLSDPSSVCLNTTSLSPYNAIASDSQEDQLDETNCNSCICVNGKPKCSNIWCGLKNCLRSNVSNGCNAHEVCVPLTLQESCLSPPCTPRGDCRTLEPSRRVAPPKLPASIECWPNQAILDENCARITILLENRLIQPGTSVEGICLSLRTLLGTRLVKMTSDMQPPLLVLLCDLKTGTNDTIEVTISTATKNPEYISQAVTILGELLSRGSALGTTYSADEIEAAPLAAILEVKVETALVTNEQGRSGFLLAIVCATAFAALILGAVGALLWRRRMFDTTGSGVNLSPNIEISRHEEEKSNNIQNEENFRRLANPLKGSASSLSGGMELSMHPTPDVVSVISLGEGSSATNKSQTIFPCDGDFDAIEPKLKSNRGSQILYKVQNIDMRKNTVGSIESAHKDFGKRSINKNCKALTPVLDSECLTVHV